MTPTQSEELLRLLVERVEDYALFVLTPAGNVATWNPGAARIKGYTTDEIVGSHFSRFYRAEEIAAGKCEMELREAARVGRFEDEGWRLRSDGSEFWANVVITALRDESGRLVGYAKVTRDLTARRQTEQDARRLAEARAAQRAAEMLQAIGTAFATALTRADVAEVIAAHVLPAVGADGGTLRIRLPPDEALRLEWTSGGDGSDVGSFPLAARGEIIGVLELTRRAAVPFSAVERALASTLANQCALALDRALAFEREQEGKRKANFLAHASATLSSTLDIDAIAAELARLVVPMLGDWCAVELVDGDGFREVATVHSDANKAAFARELRRKYPVDAALAREVVGTGKPLVYTTVTDADLVAAARSDEHLQALRTLGPRSAVILPLSGANGAIGVATLLWSESARHYTTDDCDTLSTLCSRAALAIENARLYQELQSAVRAREDFMSIAGHELRTPLAAMLLNLQTTARLLARMDESEATRVLRERVMKAQRNASRLERLIAELLDVAGLSVGRVQLEPEELDLGELVSGVVAGMMDLASRTGSELRCETASAVIGSWDRFRVEQVVINLVTNALKYGLGKPVAVRLRTDGEMSSRPSGPETSSRPSGPEMAILEVSDRGIGIEPAQHGRIFEKFERAVSERHFGGLGLGLWISRQVVDASGGSIEVESTPGEGSLFRVKLPFHSKGHEHVG